MSSSPLTHGGRLGRQRSRWRATPAASAVIPESTPLTDPCPSRRPPVRPGAATLGGALNR